MRRKEHAVFIFFLFLFLFKWNNDYWNTKWNVLWFAIPLFTALYFFKKYDWSIVLLTLYSIISSLWVSSFFTQSLFTIQEKTLSFFSLTTLFVIVFFSEYLWDDCYRGIEKIFIVFPILNSCFTLYNYYYPVSGFTKSVGLLGNASINACSIAITLPFFWEKFTKYKILILFGSFLSIAAILVKENSIGLCAFFLVSFIYWIKKKWAVTILIIIGLSGMLFFSFLDFSKWMDDQGRFFYYKMYFKQFVHSENLFWGIGNGCFPHYSISLIEENQIQLRNEMINHEPCLANCWIHAHNDWLELFISLGFIGFILAMIVVLKMFAVFLKKNHYFYLSVFIGLLFCSCLNSMIKYPFPFVILLYLILKSLKKGVCDV